jgi:hypothetical protein
VKLKPTTTMPRGRISKLKSQGAGGLRESDLGSDHSSLSAHIVGELLKPHETTISLHASSHH